MHSIAFGGRDGGLSEVMWKFKKILFHCVRVQGSISLAKVKHTLAMSEVPI